MRMRLSAVRTVGLLCLLATGSLAACEIDLAGPTDRLTPVTIQASVSADGVAGITVEVSGSGISPNLLVNLVYDAGTSRWAGSLDVPAGTGRTFSGKAYASDGGVTHEGSVTTTVTTGTNSAVALTLNPIDNTGDVPIDVVLASRALSVAPTSASVVAGNTTSMTASVSGSDCVPTWASSNPAYASVTTVSADGLTATITGHLAGSVNIVANCGGIAAAASLSVTSI